MEIVSCLLAQVQVLVILVGRGRELQKSVCERPPDNTRRSPFLVKVGPPATTPVQQTFQYESRDNSGYSNKIDSKYEQTMLMCLSRHTRSLLTKTRDYALYSTGNTFIRHGDPI